MKRAAGVGAAVRHGSRPSRGAWIETESRRRATSRRARRALHGARGLKPRRHRPARWPRLGRALHGARGLKRRSGASLAPRSASRPSRGAWIETVAQSRQDQGRAPSRPSRGAWIETTRATTPMCQTAGRALHGARGLKRREGDAVHVGGPSRPSRGAWIETRRSPRGSAAQAVAPFTGRVD